MFPAHAVRILLLNDDFPPSGGNSVAGIVRDLAAGLRGRGHDVRVLTTHRPEGSPEVARREGVTSLPSGYRLSLRQWLSLWRPAMSRMLQREMERLRPDVVHAHNLHVHLTFDALRQARRLTDRVVLTLHDAMAFAEGRIATDRYLETGDARLTPADRVAMVGLQYNPLRNTVIRCAVNRHASRVVAVSATLAAAARRHGLRDVGVVHNAVDVGAWGASAVEAEAFRARHGLAGRKVVLFAGRLRIEKGVVTLAHAVARLRGTMPEATLVVVGEERYWRGLVAESRFRGEALKGCVCTGWLDRAGLRAAYAACDVVAVPSVYLDPFVLVNLEAMASGRPLVGTCFGGTPEIVQDGVTGLIVDPRDAGAFAGALRRVLTDPALAARMGAAGRKRAVEVFSPSRQVEEYLALYGAGGC